MCPHDFWEVAIVFENRTFLSLMAYLGGTKRELPGSSGLGVGGSQRRMTIFLCCDFVY